MYILWITSYLSACSCLGLVFSHHRTSTFFQSRKHLNHGKHGAPYHSNTEHVLFITLDSDLWVGQIEKNQCGAGGSMLTLIYRTVGAEQL